MNDPCVTRNASSVATLQFAVTRGLEATVLRIRTTASYTLNVNLNKSQLLVTSFGKKFEIIHQQL